MQSTAGTRRELGLTPRLRRPPAVDRSENIRRLLAPRHVAFIGGKWASGTLRRCADFGFEGELWHVHPRQPALDGFAVYPSVEALPCAPDCAYVAVSAQRAIEVVRALAERGAGGCICFAAGYAEKGGEGVELQQRLVDAAGDMALVGPNCYGMLDFRTGLHVWSGVVLERHTGPGIALVSQSGALAEVMLLPRRDIPFVTTMSVGNQAVLGIEDFVEAYLEDPGVNVIGVYIEGLRDVARFSRIAARALERRIPIVALKSGQSETGARLTLGHTSSLAGEDDLYDALFERCGVIRAQSISNFVETLKLLSYIGPLPSRRFGAVTVSGGGAALTADYAARIGLTLTPFTDAQVATLRADLPDMINLVNPLDITVGGLEARYLEVAFDVMASGDVDIIAVMLDSDDDDGADSFYEHYNTLMLDKMAVALRKHAKPGVVLGCLPETLPPHLRRRAVAAGMAPMQGLNELLWAIAAAADYGAAERRYRNREDPVALAIAEATRLSSPPRTLDEVESKRRLAKAGVSIPAGRDVTTGEVADAADALGFPVVLKAIDESLTHKTEAGAVVTGLADRASVAGAAQRMRARLPGLADRFLVERQIDGAVAELIVGVKYDPQFGHALVIGAGGVLVELIEDRRTLLLPTCRSAVEAALDSLKSARLLQGFRGRPAGDREAVVEAILAVAALAEAERERLYEIDVNPLLVLPRGSGAIAVDALVSIAADSPA